MNFKIFKTEIAKKFAEMSKKPLFYSETSGDEIWETYLKSFPEGSDPIFRERTEHDCNSCKQFIKKVGNVLSIDENNDLCSIWDIMIPTEQEKPYQVVADAMSAYVKSKPIQNIFRHYEKHAGTDKSREIDETTNNVSVFEHLFVNIPNNFVLNKDSIPGIWSNFRSSHDVFKRALDEIWIDSIDTVLELIAQNSLYRGEEHKFVLQEFLKYKNIYNSVSIDEKKDRMVWKVIADNIPESVTRIRNTSIGSLLVDLSNNVDVEDAVKSFEAKVAPTNYKRPTAVVTKSMIENAKKTISELGIGSALERRYARLEDISINNIIYADRTAKNLMRDRIDDVFDDIQTKLNINPRSFDRIEEIGVDKFIKDVLPGASMLEIMPENKHMKNMVSLITSCDPTSNKLFKWNNEFSWSYRGEVTDSIKERVKKAGGSVEGYLCCRLSWFNYDDLDLHMIEAGSYEIYFRNRSTTSPCGGRLDVDMNAGSGTTREPVENIFYKDCNKLKPGQYVLNVHQYLKRENKDIGFEVELDVNGEIYNFAYDRSVKGTVEVAVLEYSKENGFKIIRSMENVNVSKRIWGIDTNTYHKVNLVMNSPNHWDDEIGHGNKHYFFMIDDCKNDESARGFYNEFLTPELDKHRKVLEIVGGKMAVDTSNEQLSGLGFSSTSRNSVIFRVTGKTKRLLKVIF